MAATGTSPLVTYESYALTCHFGVTSVGNEVHLPLELVIFSLRRSRLGVSADCIAGCFR